MGIISIKNPGAELMSAFREAALGRKREAKGRMVPYFIAGGKVHHAVVTADFEKPGPVTTLCGRLCSPGYSLDPSTDRVTCKRCLRILASRGERS